MATATKISNSGTAQQEELERLQQAIVRKLLALPPGWEQVVVKKGLADSFVVSVVLADAPPLHGLHPPGSPGGRSSVGELPAVSEHSGTFWAL